MAETCPRCGEGGEFVMANPYEWCPPRDDIGNVAGGTEFAEPYGRRRSAVLDIWPGDVWYYLTPRD
ncbi:MAG: hypothetical protein U0Q21_16760 [Dermatophilaceae bacterium]